MTDRLDSRPRATRPAVRPPARALLEVLLLALATTLLGAAPARAADNGSWAVTPAPPEGETTTPRSYFILEGDPGTTIKDKVRIQNRTSAPITFRLYGADGYNTTQDGFFALRDHDFEMVDVGSWVRPVTSQVTVYGRTQVDIPITIRIPENATPGDHVGGVVAMNVEVESRQQGDSFDVGIVRAVGARMYLRVSGPTTPAVAVTGVHLDHDRGLLPWSGAGKGTVTYTIENTGNVRLSPQAVIRLSGLFGERGSFDQHDLVDLLPGQRAELQQRVDSIPAFGRLTTSVAVTAEGGVRDEASATTWLVPWPGVLLVVALLGLLAWYLRRRRSALARRLAAAEEAPPLVATTPER